MGGCRGLTMFPLLWSTHTPRALSRTAARQCKNARFLFFPRLFSFEFCFTRKTCFFSGSVHNICVFSFGVLCCGEGGPCFFGASYALALDSSSPFVLSTFSLCFTFFSFMFHTHSFRFVLLIYFYFKC